MTASCATFGGSDSRDSSSESILKAAHATSPSFPLPPYHPISSSSGHIFWRCTASRELLVHLISSERRPRSKWVLQGRESKVESRIREGEEKGENGGGWGTCYTVSQLG